MEPRLRETFLLQGKVDAISAFSTSALPSLLKGGKSMNDIKVFYYNDFGLDFYGNAILAKASFIQQNPDVIRGFVKAYLRGMQDLLRDPDAGLDAVLTAAQSKLMNREGEKIRLQVAINDLIVTPEAETLGLGAVNPQRLDKSVAQTVQGFGLKGKPTIADIFTDQFLLPKVFTRESVADEPRRWGLVLGVSRTRNFLPTEIGSLSMVKEVAAAVEIAIANAGLDKSNIHFVQIKCPLITSTQMQAESNQVKATNSYQSMAYSRGASALGVAVALSEIEFTQLTTADICQNYSLYSAVASTSAGVELQNCEILVLGNSANSASNFVIGHSVMQNALDRRAIRQAIQSTN